METSTPIYQMNEVYGSHASEWEAEIQRARMQDILTTVCMNEDNKTYHLSFNNVCWS